MWNFIVILLSICLYDMFLSLDTVTTIMLTNKKQLGITMGIVTICKIVLFLCLAQLIGNETIQSMVNYFGGIWLLKMRKEMFFDVPSEGGQMIQKPKSLPALVMMGLVTNIDNILSSANMAKNSYIAFSIAVILGAFMLVTFFSFAQAVLDRKSVRAICMILILTMNFNMILSPIMEPVWSHNIVILCAFLPAVFVTAVYIKNHFAIIKEEVSFIFKKKN